MGMGSATGGGSPSSPGGKGGSSGGYNPGAEPSPSYGGGAPSTPDAFGFGPPQSPGGKGGINQPRQGPGPGQFGYGGSDYGGSPNSPGGKGGMPSQFPQQQQQLNPYQQQYQQQFMPPSQQQFSMQSPRPYQQQQQPYNLASLMQTTNLGPQQQQRPAFLDNPEFQGYQKQSEDLSRQMNDYMKQAPMYQQLQDLQGKMQGFQKQYDPFTAELGVGTGGKPAPPMSQEQFQRNLDSAGISPQQQPGQNPYQRAGLGQLMGRSQQQYFSPQQMQQDPYMNYVQNQQQAMQQQAMRSSQQQQYQAAQDQQRVVQQQAAQVARRAAEQTGTWDGYTPVQF